MRHLGPLLSMLLPTEPVFPAAHPHAGSPIQGRRGEGSAGGADAASIDVCADTSARGVSDTPVCSSVTPETALFCVGQGPPHSLQEEMREGPACRREEPAGTISLEGAFSPLSLEPGSASVSPVLKKRMSVRCSRPRGPEEGVGGLTGRSVPFQEPKQGSDLCLSS